MSKSSHDYKIVGTRWGSAGKPAISTRQRTNSAHLPREATIRFSRTKNLILSVFCSIMALAILSQWALDNLGAPDQETSIGVVLGLGIFGAANAVFLARAFNNTPRVVIFKGGISIQGRTATYVPWNKIRSARSLSHKGYHAVYLRLTDDFEIPLSSSPLIWPFSIIERRLIGQSIGFSTSNLDMSPVEVALLVEEWIAFKQLEPFPK